VSSADRPIRRRHQLRADGATGGDRLSDRSDFAAILPAAQAGGEWALSILYRRHDPAILRYLRVKAGDAADDVASQTWLDVARNLSTFRGDEDAFRGWVFTIARRRLIDHGRRRSRRPERPVDAEALKAVTADADPAQLAVDSMAGDDAARRIVELLPADQAEIVLLRVVAGLDVAAVAEITGKRPGAVRVAQHRALKRLAEALGGDA
jgi:RNA polymerase sigma-70 factor (ECF subfamily)